MPFLGRFKSITRARVLCLIRDGECQTIEDLHRRIFPPERISRQRRIDQSYFIELAVRDLATAGLVELAGTQLRPMPLIEKIQIALDLNLTELSRGGQRAVLLNPIFGAPLMENEDADVFVLMPFQEDKRPVYEDHIKSIVSRLGLSVARADDFFAADSIVDDIWQAIYGSRIIIADCSTRNANVFYEIGVAHTVGRPTILIADNIDDVPFDLRHIRCITYQYTPRGMKAFDEALEKALTTEVERLNGKL